jgi:hypothetical protein
VPLLWNVGDPLPVGLAFASAGGATYYDVNGNVLTVAANTPRVDGYVVNAAGVLVRAWLIEGQRTNLVARSTDFNSGWTLSNTTVAANVTAGPDGTGTADKLQEQAATGVHYENVGATITALSSTALSVFLKAGERSRGRFYWGQLGSVDVGMTYDLAAGTASVFAEGGAAIVASRIVTFPNGWTRLRFAAIVGTVTGPNLRNLLRDSTGVNGAESYAGVAGNGLYAWGAQIEPGATFASSYIPPSGAARTMSAEVSTLAAPAADSTFYEAYLDGLGVAHDDVTAAPAGTPITLTTGRAYTALKVVTGTLTLAQMRAVQ